MLNLKTFEPVNDIFLIKTDIDKVAKVDFDKTDSGIFTTRSSVIDSRPRYGVIVKRGSTCPNEYQVNDTIHFAQEAGLDIVFEDTDKKYLLMGAEKFLGLINE